MKQSIASKITAVFMLAFIFTASNLGFAQTSTNYNLDLFDVLKSQFPASEFNSNFARVTKGSGEFHVSFEPKVAHPDVVDPKIINAFKDPSNDLTSEQHAIAKTLIALINATPTGAYIRIASYNFSYKPIVDAIKSAINRGVILRILLSNNQGIIAEIKREDFSKNTNGSVNKLAENSSVSAYKNYKEIEKAIEAQKINMGLTFGNPEYYSMTHILACNHDKFGGCVGEGKNHNKFLTFGKVCNFGLDANSLCKPVPINVSTAIPVSYSNIVAQMTMNVSSDQIEIFNTLSVLTNEKIYNAYRDYYQELYIHKIQDWNQVTRQPNADEIIDLNFLYYKNINIVNGKDSIFEFYGTPRNTDAVEDALFLRLSSVVCHTVSTASGNDVTNIRVSNAHWTLSRTQSFIQVIKAIRAKNTTGKCLVQVLGNELFGQTQDPNRTDADDNEITDADNIINELTAAGIEVLGSENHTKFLIVDQPAPPAGTILTSEWDEYLMYGSLSITSASQKKNDETWVVWKNPNDLALQHYTDSFKARWALSFSPTNIACYLNPTKWILHGYKVLAFNSANGSEQRFCNNGVLSGTKLANGTYAYTLFKSGSTLIKYNIESNAPHSVVAIPISENVSVSFIRPIFNGNCLYYSDPQQNLPGCADIIKRYHIDVYKVGSSNVVNTVISTASSASTFSVLISGLYANEKYYFKVRAENQYGLISQASLPSQTVGISALVPGMVAPIAAVSNIQSAAVSFPAPPNRGAVITSYRFYVYEVQPNGMAEEIQKIDLPMASNPATITHLIGNLLPGTRYFFKVRAKNAMGYGGTKDEAAISNLITIPIERPSAATFAAINPIEVYSKAVRIYFVSSGFAGGAEVSYDIVAFNALNNAVVQTVTNVSSPVVVNNLQNGINYYFKIVARNYAGYVESLISSTVSPGPSAPALVEVVRNGSFYPGLASNMPRITIYSPISTGGSPIDVFEVRIYSATSGYYLGSVYSNTNGEVNPFYNVGVNLTAYYLPFENCYRFEARAVNAKGIVGDSASPIAPFCL